MMLDHTAELVARLRAADATMARLAEEAAKASVERDEAALGLHDAGWPVGEIAGLLGASATKGRAAGKPVSETRVRAMLARARHRAGRPPARAGRPPKKRGYGQPDRMAPDA
jgi:hypothetical protein